MAQAKPIPISILEAKRFLRRLCVKRRQAIPPASQKKLSAAIVKNILNSAAFKKARTVATFIGFASEVLTDGIIEKAWATGKTVLIPMTAKGFHKPFFVVFRKGDRLRKTKYGPMELIESKKAFNYKSIDLVLVPGLAFDRHGTRLGYGGGVYDRLLDKCSKAKHVGLFFSTQELNRVPTDRHDKPLEMIVTETEILLI